MEFKTILSYLKFHIIWQQWRQSCIIKLFLTKLAIHQITIYIFFLCIYLEQIIYSTLQVYQRSYSQVRHIPPKMSDKFESQHSLSPTIWSDILVGRESGYLKIFFYISRGEHVKHFVIDAYFVSVLSFRYVECPVT